MEMMITLQKRPGLLRFVVIVAFIALFSVINTMLKPKPVTRSDIKNFDDWMRYFMRQPGYTVEYLDFDTFEEGIDIMSVVPRMSSIADHITLFSLGPDFEEEYRGAVRTVSIPISARSGVIIEALKVRSSGDYPVTVYYDDEALCVFYIGLGSDPEIITDQMIPEYAQYLHLNLSYGYYSSIR